MFDQGFGTVICRFVGVATTAGTQRGATRGRLRLFEVAIAFQHLCILARPGIALSNSSC